ncbi:MAG: 3'-5' exonuclease [Microscillaceae bacterium]|nr:3'-5' exonuclease [Microscillaceae bacterium]
MLDQLDLEQVLFLDIETVPEQARLEALDPEWQALWADKAAGRWAADRRASDPALTAADLYRSAGLFAEFGRVVCISTAVLQRGQLQVFSFAQADERELLAAFKQALDTATTRPDGQDGKRRIEKLCAHNGKEFDFPFLARRMIVQQVQLPQLLRIQGRRPWEVPHLDTLELWKFGDYKAFTSLRLLAHRFGIPSPKDDISGADVYRVYYEEHDLARIVAYCQKDVITLVRVLQRMLYHEPIADAQVVQR